MILTAEAIKYLKNIPAVSMDELEKLCESTEEKFNKCIENAITNYENSAKDRTYSYYVAKEFYENHESDFELSKFFKLLSQKNGVGTRNRVADEYKFYFGKEIRD